MSTTELATAPPAIAATAISMFANAELFELVQRQAKLIAGSDLIPEQFRGNISNCAIALEMASRLGASPFAVIQNLDVIHGRPSWRAVFLMGLVNNCGRFTPLQFEIEVTGKEKVVELEIEYWDGPKGNRQKKVKKKPFTYTPTRCIAWARDKATGEIVKGPPVSYDMALEEGWVSKDGSKWQTEMRELMLRYRAASFFAKVYASDVMLGMQTSEEVYDMGPEMRQAAGREVSPANEPAPTAAAPAGNPFKDALDVSTSPATEAPVATETSPGGPDREALKAQLKEGIKANGRKNIEALEIFRSAGLLDKPQISDATDAELAGMVKNLHLLAKKEEAPAETPPPQEAPAKSSKDELLDRIEEAGLELDPPLKFTQIEAACRKIGVLTATGTLKGSKEERLASILANLPDIVAKAEAAGKEGA